MYFLDHQAAEYDRKRLTVEDVDAPELFVLDEATAREWLRELLKRRPSTFQELHPQFIREIGGWQKHEKPLELLELLQQNFLPYDGNGPVPEQIHAYLSSNWKELRNLSKDDPALRAKARDRWYVPDPNKAGDLEKLREKALLKEFEAYKQEKKKLRIFRLEAVRVGFKKAWADRDYATIVLVADKISHERPRRRSEIAHVVRSGDHADGRHRWEAVMKRERDMPIKIRRISIRNYKGIDELDMEFPLPRLPDDPDIFVMGSSNGLGKTSIIECCALLLGLMLREDLFRLEGRYSIVDVPDLLIRAGARSAEIRGEIVSGDKVVSVEMRMDRQGRVKLSSEKSIKNMLENRRIDPESNPHALIGAICGFTPNPVIENTFLLFHSYRKVQEGNPEIGNDAARRKP